MKTNFKFFLATASLSIFVLGCGGGGGAEGPHANAPYGGISSDHGQLAEMFVRQAYVEKGYSYKIAKSSTDQDGYIVVQDIERGNFTAYYIDAWRADETLTNYLYRTENYIQQVSDIGENRFRGPTGLVFEETLATSKDLEKMAALSQELNIKDSSQQLISRFGLSEARSIEIARLAFHVKSTPRASMTLADYDHLTMELLGSSGHEVETAIRRKSAGDNYAMGTLIEKASVTNGVGPEHMQKIVNVIFGVSATD